MTKINIIKRYNSWQRAWRYRVITYINMQGELHKEIRRRDDGIYCYYPNDRRSVSRIEIEKFEYLRRIQPF
jgi:hypothetical protein